MSHRHHMSVLLLVTIAIPVMAQQGGVPAGKKPQQNFVVPTLKNSFVMTKCGLAYTRASAKLAHRDTSFPTVTQPAPLAISGIPANATIEKAFLWWIIENQGGGASSVSFTNTAGQTIAVAGTLIGSDPVGKCWAGIGATAWRADVTSMIAPPFSGTYVVNGLPTAPVSVNPDTDGVTLFIAYSVPGTGATGTLVVSDGLIVSQGVTVSQQLSGFQSCQDPAARSFVLLSDFQNFDPNATISFNGGTPTTFNQAFWNWEEQTTTLTGGQTTSTTQVNPPLDCIGWEVHGVSYHCASGGCKPCVPVTINAHKQYTAKFVCNQAIEKPLQVVRGTYATTINVHNPAICVPHPAIEAPGHDETDGVVFCPPVRFAKKVAVARPGETPGAISNFRLATLKPDEAFQIDCTDILSIAGAPPGSFLEGFVVIDSEGPLDVTVLYSARPTAGDVSTLEVKDAAERDVNAPVTFCPN